MAAADASFGFSGSIRRRSGVRCRFGRRRRGWRQSHQFPKKLRDILRGRSIIPSSTATPASSGSASTAALSSVCRFFAFGNVERRQTVFVGLIEFDVRIRERANHIEITDLDGLMEKRVAIRSFRVGVCAGLE